jgi:NADH-quinone oxidoreductase subunit C
MAQLVLERLKRKFNDAILETGNALGNETAVVDAAHLTEIALFLRDDRELAFDMPIDCTAVDYQTMKALRFEVIWHLYSVKHRHRLRLKVRAASEAPHVPALTPVWPGMNWFERETWDLYGIHFAGHPNLKRVLLYEEFVGHPLRKDYPVDGRQPLVEMRQTRNVPTQREAPPEMLNRP